jgi:tetratricopeptide (TPR) repeat protein
MWFSKVISALCLLAIVLVPLPATADLSGNELPNAPADPDYAAGLAAFRNDDWQGVIDRMTRVLARRPWDDDAHNLTGYAYRKLGDYRRALEHYEKALDLNPHHRGALEYLGELYLETNCRARADEVLARLEAACQRVVADTTRDDWKSGCEEWQDLSAVLAAYREPAQPACTLDEPAPAATR